MQRDLIATIERGQAVARLMAEDAFHEAVNDVSTIHLEGMSSAPPGETGKDARDYHHMLHYALAELIGTLRGYVSAGEEAMQLALLTDEDPE